MSRITVGSICSGIEAASVALSNIGYSVSWLSETSAFPSSILKHHYPDVQNIGDMCRVPGLLRLGSIEAPAMICGGTPCQAFSLAGWKKGLEDDRGNLTIKFVDIVNANDEMRSNMGLSPCVVLWENVEGVLTDKTNAFGCFISSLAGIDDEVVCDKWASSGYISGPTRNVAWRVLDAKYFGLAQQRRRLYVLAGGPEFRPDLVLFEPIDFSMDWTTLKHELTFRVFEHDIETFREYTDCLYSAYGTKWNGNAAAYNGSLYVSQNNRLRRFTPLECERLMGFPDNYTNLPHAKPTQRYQAIGNSWAVPVIRWIGNRLAIHEQLLAQHNYNFGQVETSTSHCLIRNVNELRMITSGTRIMEPQLIFNSSVIPNNPTHGNIRDVIDVTATENYYITPVGCHGILRRRLERNLSMNPRLETLLTKIAATQSLEAIQQISLKQRRGRFSETMASVENQPKSSILSLPLDI
jgi:DNA (cytosine-5)-methyltransferase 1